MAKTKRRDFMTIDQVLSVVRDHIEKRKPLAVVRIGDGENICLAQKKVWSVKKVLSTTWAKRSRNSNEKGVRLPNFGLRDKMVEAIKRADIVGIPYWREKEIIAKENVLRPLTEKCFKAYKIRPKKVCHTFVNRHFPERREFWEMLRDRKVILISKWAKLFKKYVENNYPKYNITIVPFRLESYKEIKPVLGRVKGIKADLVLVSAGVNALIVIDHLAHKQKRVAVDFGKAPMLILQRDKRVNPWKA